MKVQMTLVQRCRKVAEAERLRYNDAREIHDELVEIKTAAEVFMEVMPEQALTALSEALDALAELTALDLVLDGPKLAQASLLLDGLDKTLPSEEAVEALVDAIEMLGESLDEVEQHRDSPSDYSPDEKSYARDQVREAMDAVAESLMVLEVRGD